MSERILEAAARNRTEQDFSVTLNLAGPTIQRRISDLCTSKRVEVLLLDNLSCLFTELKENDADSWELVLPWLLDLRRKRVAEAFVAHAGCNSCMRGTSRREDAAFWILQMTAPGRRRWPRTGQGSCAGFEQAYWHRAIFPKR